MKDDPIRRSDAPQSDQCRAFSAFLCRPLMILSIFLSFFFYLFKSRQSDIPTLSIQKVERPAALSIYFILFYFILFSFILDNLKRICILSTTEI